MNNMLLPYIFPVKKTSITGNLFYLKAILNDICNSHYIVHVKFKRDY